MHGFNKSGFISALLGSIIGALFVGLMVFALLPKLISQAHNPRPLAQPGMEILNEYRCPSGETKRIFIRGIEDGYDPQGHEPAHMHDRLLKIETFNHYSTISRDYDEAGLDKYFSDYFTLPAKISGGVFTVGLNPLNIDKNDSIAIGDALSLNFETAIFTTLTFQSHIHNFANTEGWSHNNGLYFAELKDIQLSKNAQHLRTVSTLLGYIQMGKNTENSTSIVDIRIGDDVQVDFTGFAVCEQPTNNKGLTFSEFSGFKTMLPDIVYLSCTDDPTQKVCNPFSGDTLCSAALPVACFFDEGLILPDKISSFKTLTTYWSGGQVAYTPNIRGDTFKTIAHVNAYCASEFGKNWRALTWHEGGGNAVTAKIKTRTPGRRAWVDIKDQPYGTCWTR